MAFQINSVNNEISSKAATLNELKNLEKNQKFSFFDKIPRYGNSHNNLFNWVNQNRATFKGKVYGPLIKYINCNDKRVCRYLNHIISQNELLGYICTDSRDITVLTKKSQEFKAKMYCMKNVDRMDYNVRSASVDYLRSQNVEGYLDNALEIIDCDNESDKQMIKDTIVKRNGLTHFAYSFHTFNPRQRANILTQSQSDRNKVSRLITPKTMYLVGFSRYGNHDRNVKSDPVNSRIQLISPKKSYTMDINQLNNDINILQNKENSLKTKKNELDNKENEIRLKLDELNKKKKRLNDRLQCEKKYIKKIERTEKKLDEAKQELVNNNIENKKKFLNRKMLKFIENRNKLVHDISGIFEIIEKYKSEKFIIDLKIKHFTLEIDNLKQNKNDLSDLFKNLENQQREISNKVKKQKIEYKLALKKANAEAPKEKYQDKWGEYIPMNAEQLTNATEQTQIKRDSLVFDKSKVERYKKLRKRIEKLQEQLTKNISIQENNEDEILTIKEQWFPLLQEKIKKISLNFGNLFKQFNAQGKVSVLVPESKKYDEYCINIETKFREDQPFVQLSAHNNSGGEKSVTTMLYLLALQSVTTVPFRVVDEINQGMDGINERRIMRILNNECSPTNNGITVPQYFVVTPKLLPNLKFSKYATVFIIFNGPFQVSQSKWDINKFLNSRKPGFTKKYHSTQTQNDVTNLYTQTNTQSNHISEVIDNDDDDDDDDDDIIYNKNNNN